MGWLIYMTSFVGELMGFFESAIAAQIACFMVVYRSNLIASDRR